MRCNDCARAAHGGLATATIDMLRVVPFGASRRLVRAGHLLNKLAEEDLEDVLTREGPCWTSRLYMRGMGWTSIQRHP